MSLLERLSRIDTTSLHDADKSLRVLPVALRPLSSGTRMLGRAVTADARDDLVSVLAALQLSEPGDVLVVTGGSPERALLGELFATEAVRRGMTGIVIDGLCRDTGHLSKLPIPVYSRGCTPHAAGASLPPIVQVPVLLGGVEIRPGDILLGDNDGILVASETELLGVIDAAEAIQSREQDLRSAVEGGESLFAQLNFDEHVAALSAGRESALAFA